MNTDAQSKPTVLVVDDNEANIDLLLGILGQEYRVMAAIDGPSALEVAQELKPDLILLDIMMPDMNGYEVCRLLKANDTTRTIPVIFCTALNEEADESKGLELGAVDYITKPVKAVIVKARVKTHLELKYKTDLLEELIRMDGLTRIANRRGFNEALANEWWRSARDNTPLSLILMDIDHFKKFNDHYGHPAGDFCLQRVAEVLATSVNRPGDHVSRYGGEEFAAILPNTDLMGAMAIAERIRRNLETQAIEHAQSDVARYVTVSLGVATLTPQTHNPQQQLVELADRRLYLAKSFGRNRVVGEESAK